jgi:hypothetical protein
MAPRTLNLYLDLGGWEYEGHPRDGVATCEGFYRVYSWGRPGLRIHVPVEADSRTIRFKSGLDPRDTFVWRRS